MFDIKKEISFFIKRHLSETSNNMPSEELLISTQKTFKRIGKEQYNISEKIEELMLMVEEQAEEQKQEQKKEKNNIEEKMRSINLEFKKSEKEKDSLVDLLIFTNDTFEDLFRFVKKSNNIEWYEQMEIQWKKIGEKLLTQGITRIDPIDTIFSPFIHTALKTSQNNEIPNEQITEVIQSGYMYKGNIIRKAKVIVNQIEQVESNIIEFTKL